MNETPKITLTNAIHREQPVVKVEFAYNSEQGKDLRIFREILKHESSGTSEVDTHVSAHNFLTFKNSLDELL